MKTPIQEAIDHIEDYTGVYCTSEGATFSYLTPEGVKELLESMLEKERQRMEEVCIIFTEIADGKQYRNTEEEDNLRGIFLEVFTETFNK